MTDSIEFFTVEYRCDWACRIELDLTDLHDRFTRARMRKLVNDCHLMVHAHPGTAVENRFTVANTRTAVGAR